MSVDVKVRERILLAVEEVRKAVARHKEAAASQHTASIHQFPTKSRLAPATTQPSKLHLMLPKPHTSIW